MRKFLIYETSSENENYIVRMVESETAPPCTEGYEVMEVPIDFQDPDKYFIENGKLVMKKELDIGYEDNQVLILDMNGIDFILPEEMDIFVDDKWAITTDKISLQSSDPAEYKLTFKNKKYFDKTLFLRFIF